MTRRCLRIALFAFFLSLVVACRVTTPESSPTPPVGIQATAAAPVDEALTAQPAATVATVEPAPQPANTTLPPVNTPTEEPEGGATATLEVEASPTREVAEKSPTGRPEESPIGETTATVEAENTPTEMVEDTPASEPEAEATETVESEEEAGESRPLEPEWYQDSDGNYIPDLVEEARGYDPLVDDCARDQCSATGAEGLSLLMQEHNTLFVFDSSGSMAGATSGGQLKIDAAKNAIQFYTRLTPDFVKLGLMVYGHKGDNTDTGRAESCAGIELLAPLGELRAESITDTLALFQPTGWTPIAAALQAARQAFASTGPDAVNKIILVTDGIETCDGDPVGVAQSIFMDTEIELVIDVVGFDIQNAEEVAQLQQIAQAGGGQYFNARSGAELQAYFDSLIAAEFEIYDAMACLFNTAADIRVCEEVQRSSAEVFIQNSINTARNLGEDEKIAPYEAILVQIGAGFEERVHRWETLLERREELLAELEELRQLRRELSGQ